MLDFGLAAIVQPASPVSSDPANSPTLTINATREGVILGTAAYMSPERARGTAVDKRADIWSFGVVLFEMLTGRITFAGDTISDTLASVLKTDPDWSALPADTPARSASSFAAAWSATANAACTISLTQGWRSTRR